MPRVPDIPLSMWVGVDDFGGIANPGRPDIAPPPHWRLELVDAVERPRHPEVSPDGSQVAFVLDRDTSDIWTLDLGMDLGSRPAAPTRLTVGRTLAAYWADGGPAWSPNGELIAYEHGSKVWVVPSRGGLPRHVCDGTTPVWIDDMQLVVTITQDRPGGGTDALARVTVPPAGDPASLPSLLTGGFGDRGSATVSPDRRRVASTMHHRDDLNCTSTHVTDLQTGVDIVIAETAKRHTAAPAWSPDGTQVGFTDESPGWHEIFVAPADGSEPATQLTHGAADFADLRWSEHGIVATRSRAGIADLVHVDTSTGKATVLAEGGTWSSPRLGGDGIVACHESHETPPRLCLVSVTGEVTDLLAPAPSAIKVAPHVVPEHVSYRSLDGMEVHGWLFRPATATSDQPVPAVVYPHGGPTSVTGDEWDGVAQYFVDKGYAWFSVNVRGSTTYGREFERANHGVCGVRDTEDCLAAYDHLASLDWVDAKRVGIFGSSYGSYMALHALVDDPHHRYACGVAKYGDCDILTSWALGDLVGRLDLERMMGHPSQQREAYEAGSPIHRVDQITAPILIAHGAHDDRVHPKQSIELVEALKRENKTYEYVTYTTEAHGFLRTGPFLHFYGRLERFFDWYLR
ncbi:MAG TPA: S9 family peptidase [Ilumatobacter sp.]|nr:S9 family peptidase [Ilumatobacter sp.]